MANNHNGAPSSDHNQGGSANSMPTGVFTDEQAKVLNERFASQDKLIDNLNESIKSLRESYAQIIADRDAKIADLEKKLQDAESRASSATDAAAKAQAEATLESAKEAKAEAKREAAKKGVGAAATAGAKLGFWANLKSSVGNAIRAAFGHKTETTAEVATDKVVNDDVEVSNDEVDAVDVPPIPPVVDAEAQPTQPLDPNAINDAGESEQQPALGVISSGEGVKPAGTELKSQLDSEDNPTKEKMSLRKKIVLGIAGVALTAATIVGCAVLSQNAANVQAADAATQTETLNNETDDLENVLATDTATLSSADLDAQMDSFNKEKSELSDAVQNNPNAEQASIDEANDLLNSEQVQQYEATLRSLIEARDARQAEADRLGITLEEYAEYEEEANTLGYSIDRVVEINHKFNVPANVLGTAEAQPFMRDNLTDPTNISEALDAETPQEAMEMLLFSMHNNYGTLAMMVNAMDEDGGVHDAGLDGLETPADIQKLYAEYKANPDKAEEDFIRIRDALKNADIYQRDATSANKYSMFCSSNDELVCSYHAENDNGNKIIYHVTVYDENGNPWFEFEFKQTCTQLVAGGNTYTPTTPEITTTTSGNPGNPGNPGTPPEDPPTPPDDEETPPPTTTVESKDPTDNDKQQNDAEGFEDDAPATDEDQTTGDDGMPEGDETGQIPGHQDTGDQDGGAEDRPSEDNAVEGESAQTGNESGATDGLQSVTVDDDNLPGGGAGPAYDMGDGNIVYGDEALKEYLANQGVSE